MYTDKVFPDIDTLVSTEDNVMTIRHSSNVRIKSSKKIWYDILVQDEHLVQIYDDEIRVQQAFIQSFHRFIQYAYKTKYLYIVDDKLRVSPESKIQLSEKDRMLVRELILTGKTYKIV